MKVVRVKNTAIGEGMTKICVPVTAATDEDLTAQIRQVKKSCCDLVEYRADYYEDCFDREKLKSALTKLSAEIPDKPVIFTFRTASEGGQKNISDEEYVEMLTFVIENGLADLIDIEYFMGNDLVAGLVEKAHDKGCYVILSNHDFKTTIPMERIVMRYKSMIEAGADIAKIAMMPEDGSQVVDMMQAAKELEESGNETPLIVISMGELGVETRTTGEMYGNCISFGTAGIPSAPGQIEASALREQLEMIHNIIHSVK